MKKIALLGSAPSSWPLAPFDDPSWEIWACSPSTIAAPRTDAWFELHSLELARRDGSYKDYLAWLTSHPKLYVQEPDEAFPNAIVYPIEDMIAKYGRYFFTSSLSFMFALAIEQRPEGIGLWGVDMSASEEYGYQRAGCHYFIQKALDAGIHIKAPPESDLLEPPPMYAYRESDRMWRKLNARKKELLDRMAEQQRLEQEATTRRIALSGALDDLEYVINTWPNGAKAWQK